MRATSIFSIFLYLFLFGCAPVEVAKEVTKATKSIETSVKKIFKSEEVEKIESEITLEEEKETKITLEEEKETKITLEKEKVVEEKKKKTKVVLKQKKASSIDLMGKSIEELNFVIGEPLLIRKDSGTTIARFDSDYCRLFVFLKTDTNNPIVEYFEIRSPDGNLIDRDKDIETCFKEIKPV